MLLPLVDEAVDLGQLRGVGAAVDQQREGAAGFDGLELMRVTDEQDLGARACGDAADPVERRRVPRASPRR